MSAHTPTPDLFGWHPAPSIAPVSACYPNAPGFKGERGGPSEQAANALALSVTGRRREVLDYLRRHTGEPPTADQIAVALARSPFSIRPRVAELRAAGLIEPDTTRGRNESGMTAHRWRLSRSIEAAPAT